MEILSMESLKVMEYYITNIRQRHIMKGNLRIIKEMDMENIILKIIKNTKENLKTMSMMEKGQYIMIMVLIIKVDLLMEKKMEKEQFMIRTIIF